MLETPSSSTGDDALLCKVPTADNVDDPDCLKTDIRLGPSLVAYRLGCCRSALGWWWFELTLAHRRLW